MKLHVIGQTVGRADCLRRRAFPRPLPFAPLAPRPVVRPCSRASSLVWRSLTFHARASTVTAPHLHGTDQLRLPAGQAWNLPVPAQRASPHARFYDHAGPSGHLRSRIRTCCLPPSQRRRRPESILLRLNGWPVISPTDASPSPSPMPTHGSGPVWLAPPSPCRTLTDYSLLVSRRTAKNSGHLSTAPIVLRRVSEMPGRSRCPLPGEFEEGGGTTHRWTSQGAHSRNRSQHDLGEEEPIITSKMCVVPSAADSHSRAYSTADIDHGKPESLRRGIKSRIP